MKLTGHEQGVAELKTLHAENNTYLKFLIDEARTNTDLMAEFRGKDGTLYILRLDLKSGDMVVELAENQRPSKLPGPA